jgi:hypothetical protein
MKPHVIYEKEEEEMKKLVALLCAGVMAFSMSMVAFANESVTSSNTSSTPESVYVPSTGNAEADKAGKVAVYETVDLPNFANAKVLVAGVSDSIKTDAIKEAASLGLASEPFAYVDVNVTGYTDGTKVSIPFNLNNVVAGESIVVLHQLKDGTWETLIPDKVENGKVVVTFTSLSPVVFVRGAAADALKSAAVASPKTGDIAPFVAVIMVAALGCGLVVRKKVAR